MMLSQPPELLHQPSSISQPPTNTLAHRCHGIAPLLFPLSNSEFTRHCCIPRAIPLVSVLRARHPICCTTSHPDLPPNLAALGSFNCFVAVPGAHRGSHRDVLGPARAQQPATLQ